MIYNWDKFLLPYIQAVEELKIKFNSIKKEYNNVEEYSPIEHVTGRVKKVSSIIEKLNLRNMNIENANELEDIAGVRIICQLVDDIEKVVGIIHNRDGKDMKIIEERNYIKYIKESGYRSYHIIINYWVYTAIGVKEILAEIQIRTLAMNFWATIEHSLNYKFGEDLPYNIALRLKNAAEAAFLLDMEMSKIKEEIIDSQELFIIRSSLTAKILRKIQIMYFSGEFKIVSEMQEKFHEIRQSGNISDLKDLNDEIDNIMHMYYLNDEIR